ncbi:hypothetical protein AAF712_005595 [Marasmius tenuissimus]|uniref:cAMP-independent regulatory protein pac2 n=1 Tax=Marasmius tenuissimus TaxID=585030 RepID=A0ABR3A085_9AGAR|nr:hypothetical protein PM082_000175 [Marasmius tenuissimus]
MLHMQQPTCTNVRIRSTTDAHKIFYAVQRGTLKMITRRLDADERLALASGCVYAWEERGPHTEITGLGIERFTEGRRWSPSRVRDEFLFYYEKYSPDTQSSNSGEKQQPPRDWDPLVKQTYSVWVDTEKGKRKWHLTAYFTQATVDQLGTVDDIQGVGNLNVPEGHFKSTRVKKGNIKAEETVPAPPPEPTKPTSSPSSTSRAFAPFPVPSSPSTHRNQSSTPSVTMYQPYPTSYTQFHPPAQQNTSQPPSSSRYVHLASGTGTTSSEYQASPPILPTGSQEQRALRLTIPRTPSTVYHHPQPYSSTPISPEQQHHSVTSPVYSSTQSPTQASPRSPQQPSWYTTYHQKPPHDVIPNPPPAHPLRQYSSSSPDAAEPPPPASPYNVGTQQPYMPLTYHTPTPIRPISSEALSTSSYPHTADVPSTSVLDPSAQYTTPPDAQIPLPHLSYPAVHHSRQHVEQFSRPSTSHFREHSILPFPELHSASPASSASGGSGGSVYSMVDASGDPLSLNQPVYDGHSHHSPDRDPEHGNRGLAPLGFLKRPHPYRRHPGDDKALRLLARRNGGEVET